MNRRHFLVFNLSILCILVSTKVNAQGTYNEKENARIFVQKFYDWYSALYNADVLGKKGQLSSQQIAMKHVREYFSTKLQKALTNYYNRPVKDDDIGLDFDPFIAGQDSGEGYETGNVKQVGGTFLVDVHNIKKGNPKKDVLAAEILAIAEVAKEHGHWVIINFIYPSEKANLLDLLKNQAKK